MVCPAFSSLVKHIQTPAITTATRYPCILCFRGDPRYFLPALSASSTGLSAVSVPRPHQLFLPGLCYLSVAVLPQDAGTFGLTMTFNLKTEIFILAGFIYHHHSCFSTWKRSTAILSTAQDKWIRANHI